MGLAETAALAATLDLKGNFVANLGRAQGSLNRFQRNFSNTSRSIGVLGRNIDRALTGAVIGTAGALVGAVKVAGDFEAQLRTINTIARVTTDGLGGTHDALDDIGDSVRKIARDTGTPLEELTQGYYDLLSAGIKAADATNVLNAANRLAIGGLATTAETVDLLTTAINTYGGDATKAAAYADYFAKAVERGKVTADEIAASFAQVGPIAAASGIDIKELAAGYARLTAAGVPAAEAATQMRSAIVALTRTTKPLEDLQKATGRNYLKLAGREGLVAALQQLRTDATKAGVPLIDLFGRVEGLNFALQTTGPNFAAYNADLAAVGDSAGTAAAQMAERQQGLNFQLGRLKALAKDAGITIGSALLPKITPLLAQLNEFLSNNQGKIAQFGQDLADAFTKIDWGAIAGGLKITGQVAKTIVDTFLALPPDIQKLAIAALAINKVGGGIVTSGIKDIAGLLLRNLTTVRAVNVNVIGANVTGGGIGGVAGAAGGPGVLATAFKILPVALIGFAVGEAIAQWNREHGITPRNIREEEFNRQNPAFRQFGPMRGQPVNGPGSPDDRNAARLTAHHIAALNDRHARLLANQQPVRDDAKAQQTKIDKVRDKIEAARISAKSSADLQRAKLEAAKMAVDRDRDAVESSRIAITSAQRTGASQITSAIQNNKPVVNVSVSVVGDRVRVNYESKGTTQTGPSGVSGPGHGA